jgi:hypothetical protein
MQQNNTFSFNRMYLLYKQAFIENKKDLFIYFGGLCGGLVLFMTFFITSTTNWFQTTERWDQSDYMVFFLLIYVGVGVLYNSMAFPEFRSKERSLTYLMLPVSRIEKFTFEFINKIVLYALVFPLLFWLVINMLGLCLNSFYPQFENYQFDLIQVVNKLNGWQRALAISAGLLAFTIPFTGASYFQKKTLIKTLLSLAITLGAYGLLAYLLLKGLNLVMYRISQPITFIHSNEEAIRALCLSAIATNLILLTVSYFKLKEKEV